MINHYLPLFHLYPSSQSLISSEEEAPIAPNSIERMALPWHSVTPAEDSRYLLLHSHPVRF